MTKSDWSDSGLEVLTASDFDGTRLLREGNYVVEFGAAWCYWTRRFTHTFRAWNGKLGASLAIADISDTSSPLWDRFNVKITPTIICFVQGAAVYRVDGRRMIGIRDSELSTVREVMASGAAPGPVRPDSE